MFSPCVHQFFPFCFFFDVSTSDSITTLVNFTVYLRRVFHNIWHIYFLRLQIHTSLAKNSCTHSLSLAVVLCAYATASHKFFFSLSLSPSWPSSLWIIIMIITTNLSTRWKKKLFFPFLRIMVFCCRLLFVLNLIFKYINKTSLSVFFLLFLEILFIRTKEENKKPIFEFAFSFLRYLFCLIFLSRQEKEIQREQKKNDTSKDP